MILALQRCELFFVWQSVCAFFLVSVGVLTVGVKTGAGGVAWKLGALDENAPAFGGKRGAMGEKAGVKPNSKRIAAVLFRERPLLTSWGSHKAKSS